MTKAEIRKLETEARQLRLQAEQAITKASWCVADGDDEGFTRCMAEAGQLARQSGKKLKEARDAIAALRGNGK